MRGAMLFVVLATTAVMFGAAHASAPTCDDYDNQAEAQRAADTRDADGDGIYCVIYSG
jgi:hypothetical protein